VSPGTVPITSAVEPATSTSPSSTSARTGRGRSEFVGCSMTRGASGPADAPEADGARSASTTRTSR
jgi:hypothetical protein